VKEKRKEKRKQKSERGFASATPLCAVRAGQRINQVFYIGEDKRNTPKNKQKSKQKTAYRMTHCLRGG